MLELHIRTQGRDGLLKMYQKLLVAKEQQIRDFMKLSQEGTATYRAIMNSRSWKLVMALHRLKYCLRHLF